MQNNRAAIAVSALRKRYPGNGEDTLRGIELLIEETAFYGILGPNAAGKTTLISVLCGLLKYDSGSALVAGQEIANAGQQLRKHIGLVPQEIALYSKLTVRENILYFSRMHGIFGEKGKAIVDGLLDKLQLTPHAWKRIERCSGGIKRRANIAAGMVHSPQILILDEPTVGVDAQSRNLIFDYLRELNAEGTIIIYTTHYIDEAQALCTQVSILDDGKIVESGSPDELIAKHAGCADLGDVFLKITGKALRE